MADSEKPDPCSRLNCICSSVPGWPQEIIPGWLSHLHSGPPKVVE